MACWSGAFTCRTATLFRARSLITSLPGLRDCKPMPRNCLRQTYQSSLLDYKVIPTDFDALNPKSWVRDALFQPESKAAYAGLKQGWTDSLRHLHPDEQIFTYWDYFRNRWERNSGLRIGSRASPAGCRRG